MLCLHGAPKCALFFIGSLSLLSFASLSASAKDSPTYEVTLKDQTFTPAELKVPAGTPFTIKVKNVNDAPAEFESTEMKFEKIVAGHSEIVVRVKPLPGGTFDYYDEYQEDVARGEITAE